MMISQKKIIKKETGIRILGFILSIAMMFAVSPAVNTRASSMTEQFVTRLYRNVMEREPDTDGLNYWTAGLTNGSATAAEVSEKFILSEEFTKKNLSPDAYIEILYTTMMDRNSDTSGMNFWQQRLNQGSSRTGILRQFLLSSEFQGICDRYGIKRGTPSLLESRDENLHLTSFINQQYEAIFGRPGDIPGLNHWTNLILHQNSSIESTAKQFLNSIEFTSRNHSTNAYLKILYRAFMGREGDADGIAFWTTKLVDRAQTDPNARQWVFEEFVYSDEFKNIITSYGLKPSERPKPSPAPAPTPSPSPAPTPSGGPLAGKIVIVDAGHGGSDSGTSHAGVEEKVLTLKMAQLTKQELEAAGATVVMTRTSDSWVSLYNRIALAHLVSMQYVREKGISPLSAADEAWYIQHMEGIRKNNGNDKIPANMGIMAGTGVDDKLKPLFAFEHKLAKEVIYVSIHVNASNSASNTTPRGLQVYYPTDDAVEASEIAQEARGEFATYNHTEFPRRPRYDGRPNAQNAALANSLQNTILAKVPSLKGNSSRTIPGNYAYLREHGLVCVMVETGFMTNPTDRELLQKNEIQKGIAQGIRDGCISYFSK